MDKSNDRKQITLTEDEVSKFIKGEPILYESNKRKLVQDMAKTNSPYYDP